MQVPLARRTFDIRLCKVTDNDNVSKVTHLMLYRASHQNMLNRYYRLISVCLFLNYIVLFSFDFFGGQIFSYAQSAAYPPPLMNFPLGRTSSIPSLGNVFEVAWGYLS